ncbi:MAG: four helix bundle protein [Opitutae bacterium]|nr:four helix bundle protein [Opitutae bacterium]
MNPPPAAQIRFRFQKLEVWHDARRLNLEIYRLAGKFPPAEQFALTSQVRRASVSIAANIAEGSGRNSDKDFAHYLEQSYGSAMELASHLFLAGDLGYVDPKLVESALEQINGVAMRMAALNRSLNIKTSKVKI